MLLKYFVSLTIFRKKSGSVLRCSFQWICLCIKYKYFGNYPRKRFCWSCGPQMYSQHFFLEICRSFRATSEKLALENFFLAYHTIQPIELRRFVTAFPSVFVVFVLYKSKSYRYNGSLGNELGYSLIYLPES